MKNKANHRPFPWMFVLLTFILTWTFWFPVVLYSQGVIELPLPIIWLVLGSFGPTVAAFLLTLKNEGKKAVMALLKKGFDFRIGGVWYFIIFLLIPLLVIAAIFVDVVLGGQMPETILQVSPWLIVPMFIGLFFVGGSFNEEFGWRGYLLVKLQQKNTALVASLMIGVIWAIWHLPMFYIDVDGFGQKFIPFWLYFISTVSLSIIFTWLHNNTKGSLFTALLFHTAANMSFNLFPVFSIDNGAGYQIYGYYTILSVIFSIILIFVFGAEKLVRAKKDEKNSQTTKSIPSLHSKTERVTSKEMGETKWKERGFRDQKNQVQKTSH